MRRGGGFHLLRLQNAEAEIQKFSIASDQNSPDEPEPEPELIEETAPPPSEEEEVQLINRLQREISELAQQAGMS